MNPSSTSNELGAKPNSIHIPQQNESILDSELPSLNYEEVPVIGNDDEDQDDFSKIFNALSVGGAPNASEMAPLGNGGNVNHVNINAITNSKAVSVKQSNTMKGMPAPETMSADDFVRNYLVVRGMHATLDTFQCEFYENQMSNNNRILSEISSLPDIYQQNLALQQQVQTQCLRVENSLHIADEARGTWSRFKRERDTHRLHHRRLAQEKNALLGAVQRLRNHIVEQEPLISQLQQRYEALCKDKLVLRAEKNKLTHQVLDLQKQLNEKKGEFAQPTVATLRTPDQAIGSTTSSKQKTVKPREELPSALPPLKKKELDLFSTSNDNSTALPPRPEFQGAVLSNTFKAHKLGVTSLSVSSVAPVLATGSDDHTWRLQSIPSGEVIMTGSGHTSWISSVAFSPSGAHLATASADHTVKVWSLAEQKAVHKFQHSQPVWSVAYHNSGNCLVTGGSDKCARLWDAETGKNVRIFRGHTGTINGVKWANTHGGLENASIKGGLSQLNEVFVTSSSDGTASFWDARSGICIQTLEGHRNALTSLDISGGAVATSDITGIVKLWDIVANMERTSINIGNGTSVSTVRFDSSATCLLVGTEHGKAQVYSIVPKNKLAHSNTAPSLENIATDKAKSFFYGLAPEYGSEIDVLADLETQDAECINDLMMVNNSIYGATSEGKVLIWEI